MLVDTVVFGLFFFPLLVVAPLFAEIDHDALVVNRTRRLHGTFIVCLHVAEPVGDPLRTDAVVSLPLLIRLLERVHVLCLPLVPIRQR